MNSALRARKGRLLLAALAASAFAAAGATDALAFEIRSDIRVDLMGLLQRLSSDNSFDSADFIRPVPARFEAFRSHAAVLRLAMMADTGFYGNVPGNYAVYLSTAPELHEALPVPGFFVDNAGGREVLDAFLQETRAFIRDAGFMEWYASQSTTTARLQDDLRDALSGTDLEGYLGNYLGLRSWDRWVVVPSVFFPPGATSSWVLEQKPGLPDIYVIYGPDPVDKVPFIYDANMARQIWAEAIYSTAYMMVEFCRPHLRAAKGLCKPEWGLKDEENCFTKRLVIAVQWRLQELLYGKVCRESQSEEGLDPGVHAALKRYERSRGAHPDMIGDFADLLAPLQSDGRPPKCLLLDEERFEEELYARRVGWYLDMLIERSPDADLYRTRARLRKMRGDAGGARADLVSALRTAPREWRHRQEIRDALKAVGGD